MNTATALSSPPATALAPVVAIHLAAALGALAVGPVALRARKGSRAHRASGYAWVTLMVLAALSALAIRDHRLPNIAGFSPIHLLVPFTLFMLARGMAYMLQGNIGAHRKAMWGAYLGSCVLAGVFALLPGRFLGKLVWHQWLGVL